MWPGMMIVSHAIPNLFLDRDINVMTIDETHSPMSVLRRVSVVPRLFSSSRVTALGAAHLCCSKALEQNNVLTNLITS